MTHIPGTTLFAQASESFWLPPPDSTTAGQVHDLFYFILWVCTFFFLLIVSLMVYFVIRYRRREGVGPGDAPSHNTPLEITWSVIPLIIVTIIFYWGFVGYMDMRLPPRDSYEIEVVARQWVWQFKYANGYTDEILHVPAGQPIRLVMRSEDVIHSLSIPDYSVKMDVVPGRYTKTWFKAKRPGTHELYCTEYCGTDHSTMVSQVVAHTPADFQQWLEKSALGVSAMPPVERGRRLFVIKGCAGCHSIDGGVNTGPSLKGIWGETHRFRSASPTVVDENYIRESIVNPSAKVREGYENQMNSYQGQLSDEELGYLIKFIQSLE